MEQQARSDNLSEHAYTLLKKGLKTGAYAPGQKITIRATATALGMSTMPVRDAFRRLISEGALESEPNKSARVPGITPARINEISKIRMAVEGLAAQEAALRPLPEETLSQLESLQVKMAAAKDRREFKAYMAANEEFHFTIYHAAQMPVLLDTIETLWLRAGTYLSLLLPDMRGIDLHREIIDALKDRDAARASDMMARDIERAAEYLFSLTGQPTGNLARVSDGCIPQDTIMRRASDHHG